MRHGEHAAACDPSLAHLHIPHGLATHPVLSTYPCHAPVLARVWHITKRLTFLNPAVSLQAGDLAMFFYHTFGYCTLLTALVFHG